MAGARLGRRCRPRANAGVNPGKTLGIVGLVLAFFFGLTIVGLILSIVGLNKSKKAGFKNGPGELRARPQTGVLRVAARLYPWIA